MNTQNGTLILTALFCTVAFLTNPQPERHKEAVKSKLSTFMQQGMKESLTQTDNEWEQAGQALGLMLGGALVDRIVEELIATDNFLLFSTTRLNWDGDSKIIGVGIFGNVFLSKDIDHALDQGLLKE
jgi:hypothetical protein